MTPREAVLAIYGAAPHIPPRGTVEYHQGQLRQLLQATTKDIAKRIVALPARETQATIARRRAHEQYDLEVAAAVARRDLAISRADALVEEARGVLEPLQRKKEQLTLAVQALQLLAAGKSEIDWRAVRASLEGPQPPAAGWDPAWAWLTQGGPR